MNVLGFLSLDNNYRISAVLHTFCRLKLDFSTYYARLKSCIKVGLCFFGQNTASDVDASRFLV